MRSPGSMSVLAVALATFLSGCGGGSSSDDGGSPGDSQPTSYDGAWNVTVSITTCYGFTGSAVITVTDGSFVGTLFTYCANPTSGDTYLSATGCGSHITETVSIDQGLFSGSRVEGNLYLTGGACNGGNGFYGVMDSATAGDASSYWGTLSFQKL